MAKSANMQMVGSWAFIIGVVLAILIGIWTSAASQGVSSLLIVLGLIVGLLNVTAKETKEMVLLTVALVIILRFGGDVLGGVQAIGPYLSNIVAAILNFVIPAALVVILKGVYSLESKK